MKKVDRIKETEKVMDRISALESVSKVPAAKGINGEPMHVFQKDEIIEEILNEYVKRYTYLEGAKEYMVHFKGGGWNTCYGRDEEEAFVNAKLEHESNDDINGIDQAQYAHKELKVRSVSLATEAGKSAAMRLFY